ncbi:Hypp4397 [Branchiostoma lanceolatum]|uniref:Hypp4397 protein n=1 Tax=Branchiostoma lanceolatum TaxID=7740 RepID=A0A8K0A7I2_BRALA|nr:Hypp4397 [Branchiostoma lanceolatum]
MRYARLERASRRALTIPTSISATLHLILSTNTPTSDIIKLSQKGQFGEQRQCRWTACSDDCLNYPAIGDDLLTVGATHLVDYLHYYLVYTCLHCGVTHLVNYMHYYLVYTCHILE